MTKDNPDILCPECKDFDWAMNRKDGVSLDVFVVCYHDWKPPLQSEWGGTLRCNTSDGRKVNIAEELNRLEREKDA